jgi:hypothetical protein
MAAAAAAAQCSAAATVKPEPFSTASRINPLFDLYLCTTHGPLPRYKFNESDIQSRRHRCRVCTRERRRQQKEVKEEREEKEGMYFFTIRDYKPSDKGIIRMA